MRKATVHRVPDYDDPESKTVAWYLLPRNESTDKNTNIGVERFEAGGGFSEHDHDFVQIFYVLRGKFEMTIAGHTDEYHEGELIIMDIGESHAGRNLTMGVGELLALDYWPTSSAD
jgi:quercetin dioxygenase-like cupin family protein